MVEDSVNWKAKDDVPPPTRKFCHGPYRVVTHSIFEWLFFAVILINSILTIVELTITDEKGLQALQYINYVFCSLYIVEAIVKVTINGRGGRRREEREKGWTSQWGGYDVCSVCIEHSSSGGS